MADDLKNYCKKLTSEVTLHTGTCSIGIYGYAISKGGHSLYGKDVFTMLADRFGLNVDSFIELEDKTACYYFVIPSEHANTMKNLSMYFNTNKSLQQKINNLARVHKINKDAIRIIDEPFMRLMCY